MKEHRVLRCSILAVGDFPEGGATSQRLYMLARLLNEGLGETSLWILHPTSKVPLHENCSKAGMWGGVKFSYLSDVTVRPSGIGGALLDTLRGIYRSARLIASRGNDRPDLIVLYTPTFMKFIVPVVVAKLLRIPVIVEVCEIYSKSSNKATMGFLRRLANSGETLMERLIPMVSCGLLVISHGIKKYYAGLGLPNDAAYLLPVLIDVERYEKGGCTAVESLSGQQFLVNSGTFSEKDGILYIIKAMADVRQDYPDIKLVFTGTTTEPIRKRILETVGSNSNDWIVFTGFLTREELIWCYKSAVGLLSCRSNSDYANYGFPTKLAEYLSSARPVVATTVGDVTEYLTDGETAFLAESENVKSIAMAIEKLLRDPGRAEKVGFRGAEVARQSFDYRNHVEKVASFIRKRIGIQEEELR